MLSKKSESVSGRKMLEALIDIGFDMNLSAKSQQTLSQMNSGGFFVAVICFSQNESYRIQQEAQRSLPVRQS